MLKLPEEFLRQVTEAPVPLTVIVNDGTRPSPECILSLVAGFLPDQVRFLFATGTHRPVKPEEEKHILGELCNTGFSRQSNMCDDGSHVFIGETSRGTPVEVHPWLLEGSILALNTVEPHYFAGFTGGRKSVFPGCTSRRTTVLNHWLACYRDAVPGKLEGNPVHEDMEEGAEMLFKKVKSIMINGTGRYARVFCGSPGDSFHSAAKVAEREFGITVRKAFRSLEVQPGGKLNVSLYQAMKAVFLWASAVEDGGDLILNANCPEGLGAKQMHRLLKASEGKVLFPARDDYLLGDHAALRLSAIRRRLNLTFRISSGIDMSCYGFRAAPERGNASIQNAGFTYPVMAENDA